MSVLTSLYGLTAVCELLALILALVFLKNAIQRLRWNPQTGERLRRGRVIRDSSMFLVSLLLFVTGLVFLNLGLFLQSYSIFAVGEPVARVSVQKADNENGFVLKIRHLSQPVSGQARPEGEYFLRGDSWEVEGHLVRFKPWLTFLGLKTVYQLSRVESGYFFFEDEMTKDRTMHTLLEPRDERWWKWVYENAESLPIVDMAQGSSVSKDVKDGDEFLLRALPSGFTLERVEDEGATAAAG